MYDHDYCYVEMPKEENKILKYKHGEKSLKALFMIYADFDRSLENMDYCQNNPKKSYTEKKTKHTPSGYSFFTNCSFDETKNKLDYYRDDDGMKRFCKDLRYHAMKIINYEEKEMMPLTDKENKSYQMEKVCYIYKKEFSADNDNKKCHKMR